MASSTTRGPVEMKLHEMLNRTTPIELHEVQAFLSDLLDCARDDMYMHRTFEGTIRPEQGNR